MVLFDAQRSFILDQEVGIAYADEELDDYVKEQTKALRALYLKDSEYTDAVVATGLSVEELDDKFVTFFVKRGLQVVGCAKYEEASGKIMMWSFDLRPETPKWGKP